MKKHLVQKYIHGRLRFGYKNTEVPSGRYAAGGSAKDTYFAKANIQNQPKPHPQNYYVQHVDLVKQYNPEILEAIDKSGTFEEGFTEYTPNQATLDYLKDKDYKLPEKRFSFKIMDWVFSDCPFFYEGQEEKVAEGFNQYLNPRSCFLPDENQYWVSIDYAAEELRIAALLSKEPNWIEAFSNGRDIHKATAVTMFGEDNYDKEKRKLAKGINFLILYGGSAMGLSEGQGIPYEEAEEFINIYKGALPQLISWIKQQELIAEKQGFIRTMFGRPIRTKQYFEQGTWRWSSFGRRLSVNAQVQGTGADIMKMTLMKIFSTYYKTNRRNKAQFRNMVHDECNFSVPKEDIKTTGLDLAKLMITKMPKWEFPIEVGFGVGNRWGNTIDFIIDTEKNEIVKPKDDPASEKDLKGTFKIKNKEQVEEEVEQKFDIEEGAWLNL